MSCFPADAAHWTPADHDRAAALAPLAHACPALRLIPTPGGGGHLRACAADRFAPGTIDATFMACLECLVNRPDPADRQPLPGWAPPPEPDSLFARIKACEFWRPSDCSCSLDSCTAGKGDAGGRVSLADCKACLDAAVP